MQEAAKLLIVDDDRDFGAHGDFDRRASKHSYQLMLDQRRDWIALAAAAGVRAADGKLVVGPEVYGSVLVSHSSADLPKPSGPTTAPSRNSSPALNKGKMLDHSFFF